MEEKRKDLLRIPLAFSERWLASVQWKTLIVPSSAATLPINQKEKITRKSFLKIQKILSAPSPSKKEKKTKREKENPLICL